MIKSQPPSSSSTNNQDTTKSSSFPTEQSGNSTIDNYKIPRQENNNRRNRDIYGSYKRRNKGLDNYKDDLILFDRSQIDYSEHGIEKKRAKTTKSTSLDDKVAPNAGPIKKEKRSNKAVDKDKEKALDSGTKIEISANNKMNKTSYVQKVDLPQSVSNNNVLGQKDNYDSFDKNLADTTITKNKSRKNSSTKETKPSILTNIEDINNNVGNNNSSNKSCASSSSSSSS